MATAATEIRPELVENLAEDYPPHIITLERYQKMIEAGVYHPDEPVFLWKGRLVEKMGKNNPHIFSTTFLFGYFFQTLPAGWIVRSEQPIALSDNSMPEPDLSILRGSLREYLQRSAWANRDVAMVIEVAHSTLRIDSKAALQAYAADGIPVYWIINLVNGRIEVYTRPTGPGETPSYQDRRDYGREEEIVVVVDGDEIGRVQVADVLP